MSTIYTALICILIIADAAAFILLFLEKTGLRDWLISHSPGLLSELFSCDFCFSFWLGSAMALLAAIIFGNLAFIFLGIFTAPITRRLL